MNLPTPDPDLISEDDFRDTWGAFVAPDGNFFTHPEVVNAPLQTVWTVVEAEDEDGRSHSIAQTGFHIVNVLGYVRTTKPWDATTPDAYWFFDDLE